MTDQTTQHNELKQPGEELFDNIGQSVGFVRQQTVELFSENQPLSLECGRQLGPITVAYETYGRLNPQKDNAILICHALSGDAHVAGRHHTDDKKSGWWDIMIGPGKPFNTEEYFVICSNCLGGCMGTTGPSSNNPKTQQPYGLTFPMITIGDIVELQRALLDYLGIDRLLAVVGGSMGGMQVLEWAIRYPDRVAAAIPIATTARLSPQGIAFDAVGRNAILSDKHFYQGQYYQTGRYPTAGLSVARMVGHITYLSEEAMFKKFGRRLQDAKDYKYDFDSEFSIETYLAHQGSSFVDRFDANTYLYFSKAMDYFDLSHQHGTLTDTMAKIQSRFLVISFKSDWLFPPRQSHEIVDMLVAAEKDVTYCDIDCPYGHDSFLLESKVQGDLIRGFLKQTHLRVHDANIPPLKAKESSVIAPTRSRGSIFSGERVDHLQIEQLIEPNSSVLDLGCGDGSLLAMLASHKNKNIHGMGITLGQQDIQNCVLRGVSVLQYDLHDRLNIFSNKRFNYVVLSQALQVVRRPQQVLRELLRIGDQVIVSFPNFAYWRSRLKLLLKGRAPVWKTLNAEWYDKPEESVNYMSIADFEDFVQNRLNAKLIRRIPLSSRLGRKVTLLPNLLADEVIFVISDKDI